MEVEVNIVIISLALNYDLIGIDAHITNFFGESSPVDLTSYWFALTQATHKANE